MELEKSPSPATSVLPTVLKGVLESAGIQVMLSGVDMVYPATSLTHIRLLVREDDLARAREVLAQAEVQGFADEDEDE